MDYLGVNYYTRSVVSADGSWKPQNSGLPLNDMDWEIFPEGLTQLLIRMHQDYPLPPIYITENGGAFPDALKVGQVDDQDRIRYIDQHIDALAQAMAQGVPVNGYMVWSLMDNFEWSSGYAKRFGIVHVDYASQKRTFKASAHWYQDFLNYLRQQQHDAHVGKTAAMTGVD
jgi:beta-glucosidase